MPCLLVFRAVAAVQVENGVGQGGGTGKATGVGNVRARATATTATVLMVVSGDLREAAGVNSFAEYRACTGQLSGRSPRICDNARGPNPPFTQNTHVMGVLSANKSVTRRERTRLCLLGLAF